MSVDLSVTRELGMFEFHQLAATEGGGARHWLARAQNLYVEWFEAVRADAVFDFASDEETMVLVFGAPIELSVDAAVIPAPPRSVCILPPGRSALRLGGGAACAVLASQRIDLNLRKALNEQHFAALDPRIAPYAPAFRRRRDAASITVVPIDSFDAPASNPRIKMLQSATMSINWVEYEGVRDRRTLSPHSHAELEQASLGVSGNFVHHLREPWGRNADLWREDRHIEVAPPSLMVVPVNLIHTSEGVGPGHHLLIDIFSPPRRDFIAKGWVENADAYEAPVA